MGVYMKHFAVIGSGITGVTTAWVLCQKGYDVTVFDRNRYPAMETSYANGGQLSASNAEVWTSINTMLKGLKWMMSPDAPLLFNPKPSWHKYSWMMEFASNFKNYESNTIKTVEMALAARQNLMAFADEAGINFDCEKRGILHIYASQKEFDHAHNVTKIYEKAGLKRRRLNADEVLEVEPKLKKPLIGGYFTESDFTGDIHKFTNQLAEAAKDKGVEFVMEADVTEVDHDGSKPVVHWHDRGNTNHDTSFDGVVITAGVGSRDLAAHLGDRVNIYPVKGYSITVEMDDARSRDAAPWTSLLDDEAKVVTARLGEHRLRVAGTAEFNGYNYDIRADRIRPLTRWVNENFPDISTKAVVPWAGLRPMMPNMMPHVAKGKKRGVYYNTGHGHLGWTLSCYTAEAIADVIHQGHNH